MIAAILTALIPIGVGFASFALAFALGTVVYRIATGKDEENYIQWYIGTLVLVAGAASEVLGNQGRWPQNTIVLVSRIVSGGAAGHLAADFTPATGTVSITSSSGTDTSTVGYVLMAPG